LSYIPATGSTELAERGTLVPFYRVLHLLWHHCGVHTHARGRMEGSQTHTPNSGPAHTPQLLNTRTATHRRRAWVICSHLTMCTPKHTVPTPTSVSDLGISVEMDENQAMLRITTQLSAGLCRRSIGCADRAQRYSVVHVSHIWRA